MAPAKKRRLLCLLATTAPLSVLGVRQHRKWDPNHKTAGQGAPPSPDNNIPHQATQNIPSPKLPSVEHSHLVASLYDATPTDSRIINRAMKRCDEDPGCAAITFEANVDENDDNRPYTSLYRHTFLDGSSYSSDSREEYTILHDADLACVDPGNEHKMEANEEQCESIGENKIMGNSTHVTGYTTKAYAFHRGRIVSGRAITIQRHMTILQAKEHCTGMVAPDCIAFTFPVWSNAELNTVPNVTFYSSVSGFVRSQVRGGPDEWRTYVSTKPNLSKLVNADVLDDVGMELGPNLDDWDDAEQKRMFMTCCNDEAIAGGYPRIKTVAKADTLPRILCNISRQDFYEQYEVPRKPVMLTGCAETWPATQSKSPHEWTYEKLAPRFSNHTRWRARIGDGAEDYQHGVEWIKIANAMRRNQRFYVFDQLEDDEAKSLENDFEIPDPIKGADLYAEMKSRGFDFAGPLRWFCLGKWGSGTQPHNDPYASDAWNTLIQGHKWWIIWPEEVTEEDHLDHVKCDESCSHPDPLVREFASAIAINAARTEYRPDKYAQHVLQRPGETIYVPDGLLHTVVNLDATIAITANYGTAANLESVWASACHDGGSDSYKMAKIMYNIVLNKAQRAFVRNTEDWPMETCRGSPSDDPKNTPKVALVDALYNSDWDPVIGDEVEVRYRGSANEYYRGFVTREVNGRYDVSYSDGDEDLNLPRKALNRFSTYHFGEIVEVMEEVTNTWKLSVIRQPLSDPTKFEVVMYGQSQIKTVDINSIRRFDWTFRRGNKVMAKFEDDDSQWYPGTVHGAGADREYYSIRYDDGDFSPSVHQNDMIFEWASKAFEEM